MSSETPGARDVTRRLVAREAARDGAPDLAAAGHAACERVYRELARWLGANGRHALFARALAQARAGHPVLAEIRLRERSAPALEGIPDSVQAHGAAAVAAALDALLLALVELLGRLVGDDMAARLLEQSAPPHTRKYESLERRSATP